MNCDNCDAALTYEGDFTMWVGLSGFEAETSVETYFHPDPETDCERTVYVCEDEQFTDIESIPDALCEKHMGDS